MSGWISSKLKAAENLLQQIDQQAAGTLRKGDVQKSDELLSSSESLSKSGGDIIVPLKDQLKKKSHTTRNDGIPKKKGTTTTTTNESTARTSAEFGVSSNPRTSLNDNDWTQLLHGPKQATSPASANRSNGVSAVRGVQRNARRAGAVTSKSATTVEKNLKGDTSSARSEEEKVPSQHGAVIRNLDGSVSNADGSDAGDSAQRNSYSDSSQSDVNVVQEREVASVKPVHDVENQKSISEDIPVEGSTNETSDLSTMESKTTSFENELLPVDEVSSMKLGAATSASLTSDDLKRSSGSFSEEERSDSDMDSSSSSDSESEREREERRRRKQKILAEKAAAVAAKALEERENLVARLEGEKQSLEKILEERGKQQAQEASELQTTMMETMEAADLEKEKHNKTRMEALTTVSKLEIANADLGKSLVTAQCNLEVEANRVANFSQQIHSKELALEALRKKITSTSQIGRPAEQLASARGADLEREIVEAEYSFISDKIEGLQDKARKLEANIELMKSEIDNPSEVECELKRRLSQMTDHLIQKQAQVEALSSEKATFQFRIESVTRSLEEKKSLMSMASDSKMDIESGTWDYSKSKDKPSLEEKIRIGQQQLGSLLKQLDAIFSAGSAFLRRNPTARWWSLAYLICLHFWVIYILTTQSQSSDDSKSGAVVSLENINNTARF
ncbi:hypothetical protein QQ045_027472 [Rhodiola kirilowii]